MSSVFAALLGAGASGTEFSQGVHQAVSRMGTPGWAVIVFVGVVLLAVLAGMIARLLLVRTRRRIDRDLVDRVFRDIHAALKDPVLIHQARRRVRSSRHL